MCRFLLALLLAIGLSGCQERPSTDTDSVRRIIDEHNANLERWYAAGEIDSVAARFAEDVWQLPPNSRPLVSRDSLRQFWKTAVSWGKWEFDFAAQEVVAVESLAVERGRYALKFTALPRAPMPSSLMKGITWSSGVGRLMDNGVSSGTRPLACALQVVHRTPNRGT